jgi:hypothetical protein
MKYSRSREEKESEFNSAVGLRVGMHEEGKEFLLYNHYQSISSSQSQAADRPAPPFSALLDEVDSTICATPQERMEFCF